MVVALRLEAVIPRDGVEVARSHPDEGTAMTKHLTDAEEVLGADAVLGPPISSAPRKGQRCLLQVADAARGGRQLIRPG